MKKPESVSQSVAVNRNLVRHAACQRYAVMWSRDRSLGFKTVLRPESLDFVFSFALEKLNSATSLAL